MYRPCQIIYHVAIAKVILDAKYICGYRVTKLKKKKSKKVLIVLYTRVLNIYENKNKKLHEKCLLFRSH